MKRYLPLLLALVPACSDDDAAPACDPTEVGTICTIAGNGKSGYAGDDGPARSAALSLPQDTLYSDGTLYILDWNNHRIRSLPGDGTIRHVAGRGELGGTLDDPANSDFNHPTGLTINPAGTKLVIAAWHNSMIREIDLATLEITDAGGTGARSYTGDNGPARTAALDLPASIAYSPAGDLVVMDQANQVIRSIDQAGTIHRIAGQCVVDADPPLGQGKCAAGVEPQQCPMPAGSGKFYCGTIAACTAPCTPTNGTDSQPALTARLSQPFGQSADPAGRIVFDPAGNLYFADSGSSTIRKLGTDNMITRVAGTFGSFGYSGDGGAALDAELNNPVDLAIGPDGTLYVTDVYNSCVRAIAPDQTISTVAGICGEAGYTGDGELATAATLKRPYGIELADGVLYIADTGNQVIRSVVLP